MATSVYEDLVKIVEQYLGPAAERFIKRQINFHLHKKPNEVTRSDIPKLVEWVKVSLGLLTEDKDMVDRCEEEMRSLQK